MTYYREKCGTVVAVFGMPRRYDPYANGNGGFVVDGAGGLWERANSPCASTAISERYLKRECEQISEEEARDIHPALFDFLGE